MNSTTKTTILPVFVIFLFVMVSAVLILSSSIDFAYAKKKEDKVEDAQTSKEKNDVNSNGMSVGSSNNNSNNNSNNKKYDFYGIEDNIQNDNTFKINNNNNNNENNNNNKNDKSDYVTFNTKIYLQNIEKQGFLRVVGFINGQSFKEDVSLSELTVSKNKLNVKLNVLKDTELVSLDTPDEFFVCVYHVKDINKEYNSILYFDCNEGDVQSSDEINTIGLFKPSSMKYSESKTFYDVQKQQQQQQDVVNMGDKVKINIYVPLADRKDTKEIRIAAMVRGQIQTETIKDVQDELDKIDDSIIKRTFLFDRKTDIGNIQYGDMFFSCVSGQDLNPPEGTECEKRIIKKFDKPNGLYAR